MTAEFFGIPFSLPHAAVVGFMFAGAAFLFWTAYKATATGIHQWRGNRVSRAEAPKLFAFNVSLSVVLGFVAVAGGLGMAFDLGMKP